MNRDIALLRKTVCTQWPWLMGVGLVFIVLGAIALTSAAFTTLVSIVLLGSILLVSGVMQVIQSLSTRNWHGFFLYTLVGVLNTVVGIIFVTNPGASALSLTLVLATFFMAAGLFKIISALTHNFEHWSWLLLNGLVTLLLGILIVRQWPVSGLWVIGTFIGIELIVSGWTALMLALRVRNRLCLQVVQ